MASFICDTNTPTETAAVDFKATFDPSSRQDWCELVKDIVAMANTGGGCILFGVADDGTPSGVDVSALLKLDPADVANKIHSYTETHMPSFVIRSGSRNGRSIAVLEVPAVTMPIVFTAPGTYPTGPSSQKSAFSKGAVYFRHGPKSEPGTSEDLREALQRELSRVKSFWLDGISKVVAAPAGATVQVIQQEVALRGTPDAAAIRLTSDDAAPAFRAIQADELYPYRQKELLAHPDERVGQGSISPHDLHCARRIHEIDRNRHLAPSAVVTAQVQRGSCRVASRAAADQSYVL